jgi:hypothetical protein
VHMSSSSEEDEPPSMLSYTTGSAAAHIGDADWRQAEGDWPHPWRAAALGKVSPRVANVRFTRFSTFFLRTRKISANPRDGKGVYMIIPLTGGPPVHKLYPGMNNLKSALMGG